MTPLQLAMLIHYAGVAEPYAKGDPDHANSPAVSNQRQELIRMELLVADHNPHSGYAVTDRGKAHVKALCELRLPVRQIIWVTPNAQS